MDVERKDTNARINLLPIEDDTKCTNSDKISDGSSNAVNQNVTPALSNQMSSMSNSEKNLTVTEDYENADTQTENIVPAALASIPVGLDSREERCTSSSCVAMRQSKKISFLKSFSRKSHLKNISSLTSSTSAYSTGNDDTNHLQIPRLIRSNSAGILSEAFMEVHNLCIVPAKVPEQAGGKEKGIYGSENSSMGDISTASTASISEYLTPMNALLDNKSGLSIRSSSLNQLTSLPDVSPLSIFTATVAKHKNYLFEGMGCLLGKTELERHFPDRSVTIFVATWNMNGKPSQPSLEDFLLPDDMEIMPDMFVIGTQESDSNMKEFEVMLQTTIGPSHVLFSSAAFGILHLTIFLRRDLVWFCSVPEEDSYGLRPGTYFKTKGALAISFQFFGTRILLINTHLFAHEEKLDQRIQNYKNIIHGLDLPKNLKSHKLLKNKDVTRRYDIVFWMGDLNFRLVGDREEILKIISVASKPEDYNYLLCNDQLTQTRNKGLVFIGFDEADIAFLPTFKFDVGTNRYDTSSKQRVPSYTDRILYRSTRDPINCIRYDSCPVFKTSDHKPVWGLYNFKVRAGKDDVPLAAGLFHRDIYLEGLKRRRRQFHQHSSRGCQTQ